MSASMSPSPLPPVTGSADDLDRIAIASDDAVDHGIDGSLTGSAAPSDDLAAGHDPTFDAPPDATFLAVDLPPVGRTPGVRGDDAWAEAGRKVLRFHLARMLARVPGVIAGEDPEEVHDMRVAARRMRAAWRVFGDGFERSATRRYRRDLQEIGARLGAVRDLDVLLEILATDAAGRSNRGRAGLAPLLRSWDAERETRRVDLVAVLESESFARFIAEYEAFAGTTGLGAVPAVPNAPGHVRTRMPATAWGAYQSVWAFHDDLARADLATLHQLRIAGKWLRYTLEFVREAIEPEATPLIRPVVALQDHLGAQHDFHVAATLAREFVAGSGSLTSHERRSIERFIHHLDDAVEQEGRAFGPTWRSLVAPAYRRRLGRALARL